MNRIDKRIYRILAEIKVEQKNVTCNMCKYVRLRSSGPTFEKSFVGWTKFLWKFENILF